jgi:hypothetical protein
MAERPSNPQPVAFPDNPVTPARHVCITQSPTKLEINYFRFRTDFAAGLPQRKKGQAARINDYGWWPCLKKKWDSWVTERLVDSPTMPSKSVLTKLWTAHKKSIEDSKASSIEITPGCKSLLISVAICLLNTFCIFMCSWVRQDCGGADGRSRRACFDPEPSP